MKVLGIFCVVAWLLALPHPTLAAPPSPEVPLDSWVYPALNKLSGQGLIDSSLQGDRPYSRLEVGRQVAEARGKAGNRQISPATMALLHRLESRFREELAGSQSQNGFFAQGYLKPARDITLKYIYQNASPSTYPKTSASQVTLNNSNFGIQYDNHHNGQLTLHGDARIDGLLLLSRQPLLTAEDDNEATIHLLQGKVALGLGPIELSVGRQSLWWGQGQHGSLLLTNNARPLDMIRFTTPSPVHLPWFLSYLGPFGMDVFWSRLEADRAVPNPYLAGLRIEFRPVPSFELGASRTAIFGGQGRPDVHFQDFFTILTGKNIGGGNDTSDQIAALDARLRLPVFGGTEIYGEWGGEDEAAGSLANTAWLSGVYLASPDQTGRISLRLEYADLSRLDNNSPAWYRHDTYRSGYTYKGLILGHYVGGAGRDFFSELRIALPADVSLSLNFDYQERGFDQPVREKHFQPGVAIEWPLLQQLTLTASGALDQVTNFNYTDGRDRTFFIGELAMQACL